MESKDHVTSKKHLKPPHDRPFPMQVSTTMESCRLSPKSPSSQKTKGKFKSTKERSQRSYNNPCFVGKEVLIIMVSGFIYITYSISLYYVFGERNIYFFFLM